MILADKIIHHRKKLNLTQEGLAEELGVSRQAVSKWEGALSIPDMNKIILLSDVFGVSIDYLMRDDLKDAEFLENEFEIIRKVDIDTANKYIETAIYSTKIFSLAFALLIVSPTLLIFFSELENTRFSDNQLLGLGLIFLIVLVATGVGILIRNSFIMKEYEFLSLDEFELEYGVEGIVKAQKGKFKHVTSKGNVVGIMLIILSVILLFMRYIFEDSRLIKSLSIPVLLVLIAIGVYFIFRVAGQNKAYDKLLQVGDYTPSKKKLAPFYANVSGLYWLLVTALYLGLSFKDNAWGKTWIVWPVAGTLFGVIMILASIFVDKNKS